MAVKIRLKRMGRRKRPFYRVVVMDSRSRRNGREIENLGWFDPLQGKNTAKVDQERAIYWLQQGAQPTDTVKNIFQRLGVSYRWHLVRAGKSETEIQAAIETWQAEREQRLAALQASKKADIPEPEVEGEPTEGEPTEVEDLTQITSAEEPEASGEEAPAEQTEESPEE